MISQHLDARQLRGLLKVADVFVPGQGALPSFSRSGFVREVDRIVSYMARKDRDEFLALLRVIAILPRFLVRLVVAASASDRWFPRPIASQLRLLNIGLKGVAYSLYYSDFSEDGAIHKAIGWEAAIRTPTSALAPDQLRSVEAEARARATREAFRAPPTPAADAGEARRAMAEARAWTEALRRMPVKARAQRLAALRLAILDERERILDEIELATGKTRVDALVSEILPVVEHIRWLERNAERALRDEKIETPIALLGKKSRIQYDAMGPILVISPWNYPFYQAIVPITSAFAAGNPSVLKPSEHTPLEGLVESLLQRAGWEPAWAQVVYGDGLTGAALVDERPAKVFFTGSQRTGQRILAQCAPLLVPVDLELGGVDPAIVFDDATVRRAAAGVAWGAFTTSGQSCTSVEVAYVQSGVYEAFREAVVGEARRIRVGTGDADMGAMTTAFQVETVRRHVEDARKKGARLLTGAEWDGVSALIPPIVLEGVTDDMLVMREETFGPVLPIVRFHTEEEVVRRANAGEYGLSASVWTADLSRAERVARGLVTGNVSINNVMITEGNPALPFGGTKASGFGRYKGVHGLRAFCHAKSVMSEKDRDFIETNWYPYDARKYQLFDEVTVGLHGRERLRGLVRFARAGLALEKHAQKVGRPKK